MRFGLSLTPGPRYAVAALLRSPFPIVNCCQATMTSITFLLQRNEESGLTKTVRHPIVHIQEEGKLWLALRDIEAALVEVCWPVRRETDEDLTILAVQLGIVFTCNVAATSGRDKSFVLFWFRGYNRARSHGT